MEKKVEVKQFRVNYLCDDCGTPIKCKGGNSNTHGTRWIHICPNCHQSYSDFDYNIVYPHFEYEEIE